MLRISLIGFLLFCCAGTTLIARGTDSLAMQKFRVHTNGGFYQQFSGTIGKTITLDFDLTFRNSYNNDSSVFGQYFYSKNGQPVYIDGVFRPDSSITLYEYNDTGVVKAEFNGTLIKGELFTGTRKDIKSKQEFPFSCTVNRRGIKVYPATYKAVNCARADSIKKLPAAKRENEDTTCSSVTLSWMHFNSGNKQIDAVLSDSVMATVLSWNVAPSFGKLFDFQDATTEFYEVRENWVSVLYNERQLLSVLTGFYEYQFGAAHPGSTFEIRNYDLATGKQLKLKDVFGEKNLEELRKKAEIYFIRTNGALEDWNFENGKFTLSENFSLTRGGLVLRYNVYEVGAYSQGAPEVFIPLTEIKPLAVPGSIVDRLGF